MLGRRSVLASILVCGLLVPAAPPAAGGSSALAPAPPAAPAVPSPGGAYAWADFDGDGYSDLAVGAPFEDLDGNDAAGAVNVVYGTRDGLRRRGNQLWHQGRLLDRPEAADSFGRSLAGGDFNGDGYADLAVGSPAEDLDGNNGAGAVNVIYGSPRGLRGRGNQLWHQGRLLDMPEPDDLFGWSLAAGDFDGDGYTDLAVGAPQEEVDGNLYAGAVNVVYGSPRGLRGRGNQLWHQGRLLDMPEADDRFGWSLAAGDFDGDGYVDLAVGSPFEEFGGVIGAGAVNVIYGTRRGLRGGGNQFWHQRRLKGELESLDEFGRSMAAGDLDGDGYADLAVAAPFEDVDGTENAGAVNVIYGTGRGLRGGGNQFWHQGRLQGELEGGDELGETLVVGDFDGDGRGDLAVGTPEESFNGSIDAGAVNVIYGTGRGLRRRGTQLWHQGRIQGELELGDEFGRSIGAGDFDGDGHSDLAVGAPFEDLDGNDDAGAVNVVYGTGRGLRARGNQLWHQGLLQGELEGGDEFGRGLA